MAQGIPWLGFVVYPTHRRVKARQAQHVRGRLQARWREYCAGLRTFAAFDACVQGWINHVRYADTWGLRRAVLGVPFGPGPGCRVPRTTTSRQAPTCRLAC